MTKQTCGACGKELGLLEAVQVDIDAAGEGPEWYCERDAKLAIGGAVLARRNEVSLFNWDQEGVVYLAQTIWEGWNMAKRGRKPGTATLVLPMKEMLYLGAALEYCKLAQESAMQESGTDDVSKLAEIYVVNMRVKAKVHVSLDSARDNFAQSKRRDRPRKETAVRKRASRRIPGKVQARSGGPVLKLRTKPRKKSKPAPISDTERKALGA